MSGPLRCFRETGPRASYGSQKVPGSRALKPRSDSWCGPAEWPLAGGLDTWSWRCRVGHAAVVTVTREFADRVAEVAQLLHTDESGDESLRRLTTLAVELVPGGAAAAVTVATPDGGLTFAASDQRLHSLHGLQFSSGEGPVVETLRHNEPRRADDTAVEARWPTFCRAAVEAGFSSCLALPLRTDQQPAGTVALYGEQPCVFRGVAHDAALLFAAQGGTAVRNAATYRACRRLVSNLHTALEARAVIEQAKGVVAAQLGVSPDRAFQLLSRYSQNTNRRVRKVSSDLVQGRLSPHAIR